MPAENRISRIDNLRVLATIGVIFIHVSGTLLYQFGNIPESRWWVANIYDSAVRCSVPLFVMIMGVLVLPYHYNEKGLIRRRLTRILPPFIFWGLIYLIFYVSSNFHNNTAQSVADIPGLILKQLTVGISPHFWFIYMIVLLTFFILPMRQLILLGGEKAILLFLILWIAFLFLRSPIVSTIIPDNHLSFFAGLLGYPILGYYLSIAYAKPRCRDQWMGLIFLLTGISMTAFGTAYLSNMEGRFAEELYDYLSPNVLLASIGAFLLIGSLRNKNLKLIIIRDFISKYSYGIYLVHILVIWILGKMSINANFIHPLIGILITTFLCLIISTGIIYILNKIPYVRYLSG